MDLQKLLTEQTCTCGKTHFCNIKHIIVEPNVLEKYDSLLEKYNHVLLVADQNTYQVFGKSVETVLAGKIEHVCVLKRDGILVPNEDAIAEMQKQGGQAAFIDAEHALDPAYAKKIGVDTENLLISQH